MVGRSSESLTALGDQHLSPWGLLLSSAASSLSVGRQRGVQRCRAGFLVSDFRITTAIASRYRIQAPVALDIAQDYDP